MMIDILEEHLEEASWLFDVRAHLLRSYQIDLERLAEWDERWLAHVEGLVIGEDSSRPIIERGLAEGDEGSVCAAAAVLACWGSDKERERLEAALGDPELEHREPLLLGLGLAPSAAYEKWLAGWLRSPAAVLRAAAAEIMRFRAIQPPVDVLRPLFRIDQQPSEVVRAALGLVADLKVVGCNACVEAALDSPDPDVKESALEATVKLGFRGARDRWRAVIRQAGERVSAEDLEKLGIYGTPEDLQVLVRALEVPSLAAGALRGLAWLGHSGAAEPLLVKMSDPKLGRLAGHAFSTLFGVNLNAEAPLVPGGPSKVDGSVLSAPQLEEEESLELDLWDGLPQPDPATIVRWWHSNAARFPRGTHWRSGGIYEPSASASTLRIGRLADRAAAALELGLAIRDAAFLDIRALASDQLRLLNSVVPLMPRAATRTAGAR